MEYRWGLIGTGGIAGEMAAALKNVGGGVYGVCSGHPESAQAFARRFGAERVYADAAGMLADPAVDIVYIATPHNLHYRYLMEAVRSGKHVLCEKAITVNSRQLEEAAALAREKGVTVMEAMTIYHMPLYRKLRELVESGALGKVKMVQVNFGICKEYDPQGRFFNKELAGGALLDIGVYAVSFARWFLEKKPDVVLTTPQYFETGVDEQSGILMKNDCGQMVVTALAMRARQPKRGVVAGEKGYIEVEDYPRADTAAVVYTADGRREQICAGETARALEYEVLDMQKAVSGDAGAGELGLTRDVTALLSQIRNQWGMTYPFEETRG